MQKIIQSKLIEVRLGLLLPAFLIFALWSNFEIAKAGALGSSEFIPVTVRADSWADYGVDPADLSFPPVDAAIIEDIRKDNQLQGQEDQQQVTATPSPAVSTPTPSFLGLPTLPLPTLPLPTAPIIQTLVPVVPTLVPIVPTLVPTLVAPIITLLPIPTICVPLPLLGC